MPERTIQSRLQDCDAARLSCHVPRATRYDTANPEEGWCQDLTNGFDGAWYAVIGFPLGIGHSGQISGYYCWAEFYYFQVFVVQDLEGVARADLK